MLIKSISVSNFKSFQKLDLDRLGAFNVLIGSNASGKTNFIQVFRFMRDIASHGLVNAVSMQGGPDLLKNTNLPADEPCAIRITYDPDLVVTRKKGDRNFTLKYLEITYEFSFHFPGNGALQIINDRLLKRFDLFASAQPDDASKAGPGESLLTNSGGTIHYELKLPPNSPLAEDDVFPFFLREERIEENRLLIETPLFDFVHRLDKFFDRVSIYNFDPRLPKHSAPITGKTDLEEDGSNLAICLKAILDNKDKRRKFINLMKDVLPFIEDIEVEKLDKSLLFKMKDKYSGGTYLPSPFISDGTLNMIAMIIALYFERKSLIIIEEPERSVHPGVINKMVAMMKDVSEKKQIIVTTHHPDIVRLAEPSNILYLTRDRNGFSTICRPVEREETRVLLENELGIEDLFKQDLLGL
jgi:predicted ATPase